ncbi:unnamed protein product, partial [Rotaria sordida]
MFSTDPNSKSAIVNDFNNDSRLDIIVTNSDDDT